MVAIEILSFIYFTIRLTHSKYFRLIIPFVILYWRHLKRTPPKAQQINRKCYQNILGIIKWLGLVA